MEQGVKTEMELIKYEAARQALAEARRVDEVKEIRDKAMALRLYAHQAKDRELEKMAAAIRLRAEIRAGEILAEVKKHPGGNPNFSVAREGLATLEEQGIAWNQSSQWQRLARNKEDVEAYIDESMATNSTPTLAEAMVRCDLREQREEARELRRGENRTKVSNIPDVRALVGDARFATIMIDPPWDWGDEGDGNQFGRARPDYAAMSLDELLKLPVGELADSDCHLYLWITNRSLPKGFQLIERWGFRYVTCLTWIKPTFGMGNYFRGATEHILFAVKGSQGLRRHDVGTWFEAERGPGGHSSKPTEIYELIESCSPGPYLEMFSRSNREDWTHWGENEQAA